MLLTFRDIFKLTLQHFTACYLIITGKTMRNIEERKTPGQSIAA